MRNFRCLVLGLVLVSLAGCGIPYEEQKANATVACNVMREQSGPKPSERIQIINKARKENGTAPFLGVGDDIAEAISLGLCEQLILLPNDQYQAEREQALELRLRAKALEAERAIAAKAAEHVETAKRLMESLDFEAAELCEITSTEREYAFVILRRQAPPFRQRVEESVNQLIKIVESENTLPIDVRQRILTDLDTIIGPRTWLSGPSWEPDEKKAVSAFASGKCVEWLYGRSTN
jgi:hypothetical protein